MPGLNHKGTAEQDGSNDESAIPENEAEIGQVAKRNHQEQDVDQNQRREKVVVKEIIGIVQRPV